MPLCRFCFNAANELVRATDSPASCIYRIPETVWTIFASFFPRRPLCAGNVVALRGQVDARTASCQFFVGDI